MQLWGIEQTSQKSVVHQVWKECKLLREAMGGDCGRSDIPTPTTA